MKRKPRSCYREAQSGMFSDTTSPIRAKMSGMGGLSLNEGTSPHSINVQTGNGTCSRVEKGPGTPASALQGRTGMASFSTQALIKRVGMVPPILGNCQDIFRCLPGIHLLLALALNRS